MIMRQIPAVIKFQFLLHFNYDVKFHNSWVQQMLKHYQMPLNPFFSYDQKVPYISW